MISEFGTLGMPTPARRGTVLVPTRGALLLSVRARLATALLVTMGTLGQPVHAADGGQMKFRYIDPQYIAALGNPRANSGSGAQAWGLWPLDPGPRGVALGDFERLKKAGGVAPERWKFDPKDWWLEENGLIMEQPQFPLPPGKYLVTGARAVTTVLTVHPADKNGDRRWELGDRATLHDVTHLACRSARYTPATGDGSCSPANAQQAAFPVDPGGVMPPVAGCKKQDYTVLIVIGVPEKTRER